MKEPKLDPWPACKPGRHRGGWEWRDCDDTGDVYVCVACGETKRVRHDSESILKKNHLAEAYRGDKQMKKVLRYNSDARELRLVIDDLYDGAHEHLEYSIPDTRRGQEWDGKEVHYESGYYGGFYILAGDWNHRRECLSDDSPPVSYAKTPCSRVASKSGRVKCETCQRLGYQGAPKRRA